MKKSKKFFIYFVLIAPILVKIIEWLFQLASGIIQQLVMERGISILFIQIGFIETLALLTYLIFFEVIGVKKDHNKLAFIVGIAYFLKELWNLIFVYGSFDYGILIALVIEPIFMYTIIGVFLSKFIFKWEK